MNATQALRVWQLAGRWLVTAVVIGLAVALPLWGWKTFAASATRNDQYVFYTVTKSDLPIVVTERGSLESQVQTEIRCEVENSSVDRSGNLGTQIIFIVPNGSAVKKGGLLVELDSAAIRERLDRQVLDHQRAVSAKIQAQAKHENQKTQNETAEAEATLKLELAKMQLEMYLDKENGEYKLSLDEIDRTIDESKNAISEAKAALALQSAEREGIETLFKLGYRGKNDRDQSRFKFQQAEDKLAASFNNLKSSEAARQQMEKYVKEMKRLSLQGDVDTAGRSLRQVKTDNESKLAQSLAARQEAEGTETKEQERLEKLTAQLLKCKITAPHDGMVVYAREDRWSSETEIAEGVSVRERQHIISLPDLSQMQVKTRIHEAVLDQVTPGLPVTVKIDAFPDRSYVGVVDAVAVVPTSSGYGGSSVKTYDCVVRIYDRVEGLKPGMTAVANIHVDRIHNVLTVPVQAVQQIDKDNWCFVDSASGVKKQKISLGRSNDQFVQVTGGLSPSDRVVLNPMMLFDEQNSQMNAISPDANAPETPQVPVEKLAEKKAPVDKSADGKKKRGSSTRSAKGKGPPPPNSGK